jgi:multisubunit Na+/H+ antiporter MnhB subunit
MIRLLVLAIFLLLGGLLLGRFFVPFPPVENSLRALLWEERALDLMAQVALVFSGVLGVLALLRYGK